MPAQRIREKIQIRVDCYREGLLGTSFLLEGHAEERKATESLKMLGERRKMTVFISSYVLKEYEPTLMR
jgi:hypothetical protein